MRMCVVRFLSRCAILNVDVFNCGTYTVSKQTVATAAKEHSVGGKTYLAAINGDLWMTSSYGNAKKTLAVSRGAFMINGELWATQEIQAEADIGGVKDAFAVTSKKQPIVGSPVFSVTMTNTSRGTTSAADGINRLPADNSVIIYNGRVNSSNYALDDAYEVELESKNPAFSLKGTVTAEVKAIYPENSATRPQIGAKTVLLSARGTAKEKISGFKVGDTVKFSVSVTDEKNNTELWRDAETIISGHMMPVCEGMAWGNNQDTKEYPAAFIGISDTGKVMLTCLSSTSDGVYKGIRFNQASEFCREMGYNTAFFLDGGGSATMVTLNNGTYTVRNHPSDSGGTPRSVINGVGIVWNENPTVEQGSLDYIRCAKYLTDESPTYIDGTIIPDLLSGKNHVSVSPVKGTVTAKITASADTNDPYFVIDYKTRLSPANAADYKYIVMKVRSDPRITDSCNLGLFYDTGTNGLKYTSMRFNGGGEWQTLTFRTGTFEAWSGNINSFRFDPYDSSGTLPIGYTFEMEYIALCKTLTEARDAANGIPPEGSMGENCLMYLHDKDNSHSYVTTPAVSPTCTADGHTAGVVCSTCGKVKTTVTPLPATGHNFVEGKCINCGEEDPEYIKYDMADVNGDGKINAPDAVLLKKIIVGKSLATGRGDLNGDGKFNASDVVILKKRIVGKL